MTISPLGEGHRREMRQKSTQNKRNAGFPTILTRRYVADGGGLQK
jgi:hypothetical protein